MSQSKARLFSPIERSGEGGIRTRGGVSPTQHFQCCTFGRSVTSPKNPCFQDYCRQKKPAARVHEQPMATAKSSKGRQRHDDDQFYGAVTFTETPPAASRLSPR